MHAWKTSCQQNVNLDQPRTSKLSEIVFASMLHSEVRVITNRLHNQIKWCLRQCYRSKIESWSLSYALSKL